MEIKPFKKIKRLAIIPARGDSKRIPKKNIKDFHGKPIILYPLQVLHESNLFDKIHVSSDDQDIISVVEEYGLKVDFIRPSNLSDDFTPIMPVLKYVVEEYRKRKEFYDEVWVVFPCSPFIKTEYLVKASNKMIKSQKSNFLMSVTEYPVPIEWAFRIDKNKLLQPLNQGSFAIRSQDIENKYYDTGMFYAYSNERIINSEQKGIDENIIPYFIPMDNAVDIDEIKDWEFAENLYKLKNY